MSTKETQEKWNESFMKTWLDYDDFKLFLKRSFTIPNLRDNSYRIPKKSLN